GGEGGGRKPRREAGGTRKVESSARAERASTARHEPDPRDQRDERHGHRQEERPAPAELCQSAAEDEAEREAGRPRRGVHRERLVARRAFRERRRDDRKAGRRPEPPA